MVGAVSGVRPAPVLAGSAADVFLLGEAARAGLRRGTATAALSNIILPGFTLGVGYMALLARTTRAAVVEILNTNYIRTARAKGLPAITGEPQARSAQCLDPGADRGRSAVRRTHGPYGHRGETLQLARGGLPSGGLHLPTRHPGDPGVHFFLIVVFLLVNLAVDLLYAVIDPRIDYR